MSDDNKLQKTLPATIKEKGQYFLAFGVIASMLMVARFPSFVIVFFGIFAFFLWKIFSSGSRNETREIFEFYLSANEMLRMTNADGTVLRCRRPLRAANIYCKR